MQVLEVDLADPDGPARLVARAAAGPDILVNNVGGAPARTGGFLSITDADWQASFSLNLMAAVRTTRSALPAMLAAGKGSIVTICSVNASLPDPGVLDYSAVKAALAGFCKALSKEVGPRGVRVNTVSPARCHRPVARRPRRRADHRPRHRREARGRPEPGRAGSVTGRFSRPEEVADLVLLLASDRTANVTGADFRIDGGLIPTW